MDTRFDPNLDHSLSFGRDRTCWPMPYISEDTDMRKRTKPCIYCGKAKATERDHVPPRCFFEQPGPEVLITVACCHDCNTGFKNDDERARNLLVSLEITEDHPVISDLLAGKRDRSLGESRSNLHHALDSMTAVDRYSPGGVYLGKALAFDLDQPVFDRFMDRITRALVNHETGLTTNSYEFDWWVAPNKSDFDRMPDELRALVRRPSVKREIGKRTFMYAGYFRKDAVDSLWLLRFYDGIEFMTRLRDTTPLTVGSA